MITSAENRRWPEDLPITRLADTGLPAPSLIRPVKIATIEAAQAARLGRVSADLRKKVMAHIDQLLKDR